MGVLKPYLITVFLLLVIVDVALARYYYRWFRFGRFQRTLKRCNQQKILDKLCPEVPEDDPCADIDCSCNGQCEDGMCTCELGFEGDDCQNENNCLLPEFCLNNATCANNVCECPAQYSGERCENCVNFNEIVNRRVDLSQFIIFESSSSEGLSCEALCSNTPDCTGTVLNINGADCRLYLSPVIDAISLQPFPTTSECESNCRRNPDCLSAISNRDACLLLDIPAEEIQSNGFNLVEIIDRNCNEDSV